MAASDTPSLDLVTPDTFGLPSSHYYYVNRERFGITLDELAAVGVVDGSCRIGRHLIEPLQLAQANFYRRGFKLIIKDGYRSPELYRIVYEKRTANASGGAHFGSANTDKLLNMERMIHASGNVVDIDLTRMDGELIRFRDGADGVNAHYYGFYADKTDAQSSEFQANQDIMRDVMFGLGFRFGTLVEYWHFELMA